MHGWDAGQYLRFADERTRPALDLLARIDLGAPQRIVDLGCGPGNSTGLLRERWPAAAITGLDASAGMLAAARRDYPGIDFVLGDIATWSPTELYDVVFSNAALQWVSEHEHLLPKLLDAVAPDGVLAVQMPRNHDFATHRLMRQVAAEGPWRHKLAGARDPSPVKPPEFYYDCLAPRCRRILMWETNYIQVMDGIDAIIAWLRGTGLRPFLARLDEAEERQFLNRYAALLVEEFPAQADGRVLLPYPRLFFIAGPNR
ncbi:MAG: trans-aconitate 2-methyltransferase [Alphaproteobacteria bacterium]|nr:trans-aconitate 2-methyltransferase [Alphaproteobacteria bacterium]MBV9152471.1 trans-aconitate 2-methyltransferase [Alphaproteobacteria bacterium]